MSHGDDDWDSTLAWFISELLDLPLPVTVVLVLVAAVIALLLYHVWG